MIRGPSTVVMLLYTVIIHLLLIITNCTKKVQNAFMKFGTVIEDSLSYHHTNFGVRL